MTLDNWIIFSFPMTPPASQACEVIEGEFLNFDFKRKKILKEKKSQKK